MAFEAPDVLVLGAGGIIGEAWMAGLLAGLEDASGFDPRGCSHFVGTSAGSIVAAGLAGGVSPRARLGRLPEQPPAPGEARDEAESLLGVALKLGRGAGASAAAPLAAFALRSSAAGGAAIRRAALARVAPGRRSLAGLGASIDELGLHWDGRLRIAAVDLRTGHRAVFGEPGESRLSVARAVEASCAIPGVFRPVEAAGRIYVDGGAWSLTNLDVAPVEAGTRVLCLNPTGSLTGSASLRGAIGPVSRSVAAIEALALSRRGARVTSVGPDSASAQAMGSDFMDPSAREATHAAAFAQGRRIAANRAARAA